MEAPGIEPGGRGFEFRRLQRARVRAALAGTSDAARAGRVDKGRSFAPTRRSSASPRRGRAFEQGGRDVGRHDGRPGRRDRDADAVEQAGRGKSSSCVVSMRKFPSGRSAAALRQHQAAALVLDRAGEAGEIAARDREQRLGPTSRSRTMRSTPSGLVRCGMRGVPTLARRRGARACAAPRARSACRRPPTRKGVQWRLREGRLLPCTGRRRGGRVRIAVGAPAVSRSVAALVRPTVSTERGVTEGIGRTIPSCRSSFCRTSADGTGRDHRAVSPRWCWTAVRSSAGAAVAGEEQHRLPHAREDAQRGAIWRDVSKRIGISSCVLGKVR